MAVLETWKSGPRGVGKHGKLKTFEALFRVQGSLPTTSKHFTHLMHLMHLIAPLMHLLSPV